MNKILNWLNLTSVKGLQKRSSSILNVFTKTTKELEKVNDLIVLETLKKNESIAKLQQEEQDLKNQFDQNDKLINKIKNFLNN